MNNRIERIQKPLMCLSKTLYEATGIRLDFAVDNRLGRKFDPDNVEDMLSIYPSALFGTVTPSGSTNGQDIYDQRKVLSQMVLPQTTGWTTENYFDTIPDMKIEIDNEDEGHEDLDLAESFVREAKLFYDKYPTLCNLVLCIDKLYIDTIVDKLEVGALEDDIMCEKVLRELTPYVLKYIESVPKLLPTLKELLKASALKLPIGKLIETEGLLTPDYTKVAISSGWVPTEKTYYTSLKNTEPLRLSLILLFISELLSDTAKGDTHNFRIMDSVISFIIREIIREGTTRKLIGIDTVLRNALGKGVRGSMFDILLSNLINTTREDIVEKVSYLELKNTYLGYRDYNKMCDKEVTSKTLSSKMLLKYAENIDIMIACMDIDKSDIRMYAESFFGTDADIEKEMAEVIDLSRRAAIAEIDMQYISTKYSKKDAINNAYIVIQEIRKTRRKLKTKEAQEKLDIIEDNLLEEIKKCQSFDHKKSRMTINIAYPNGYEG